MNKRARQPLRALRAMRKAPDTRALKRELDAGNPYAVELLRRRGLTYYRGAIIGNGAAAIRDREALEGIAAGEDPLAASRPTREEG